MLKDKNIKIVKLLLGGFASFSKQGETIKVMLEINQIAGIKNNINGLNIKITAGAKTMVNLNHQYSGLGEASKPYRGNICAPEIKINTEADSQIDS